MQTEILKIEEIQKIDYIQKSKIYNEFDSYIQDLFNRYHNKWKPDFFATVLNDYFTIYDYIFSELKNIYNLPEHEINQVDKSQYNFLLNIQNKRELLITAIRRNEFCYYNRKETKHELFEYLREGFQNHLENSIDEKATIEKELSDFKRFEERVNRLTEYYKSDFDLEEYKLEYENIFGKHHEEFEYLRIKNVYYNSKERWEKRTFLFMPTIVRYIMFKKHLDNLYSVYENKLRKEVNPIDGFIANFNSTQIVMLFEHLSNKYLIDNINKEHFISIFSSENIPNTSLKTKISWKSSIPLFCCLFFGYENIEFQNNFISFKGVINSNTVDRYKKAVSLFSFGNKKVTNKTLSEKVAKLHSCNAPKDFIKISEIIKTVQSTV